jgi:hypothetical protein
MTFKINQNQGGGGNRVPTNRRLFELPDVFRSSEQPEAVNFNKPRKSLGVINCAECSERRELDGYVFKLVPVCSGCRTERGLEILSNQIERRAKR